MSTLPLVIFAAGQLAAFVSISEPPAGIVPSSSVRSRDGALPPAFAQVMRRPARSAATESEMFVRTMNSEPSPPPSAVELITSAMRMMAGS